MNIMIPAVAGAAIGAAVSFVVTKKVLGAKYDTLLQEEIRKTKEHYERRQEQDAALIFPPQLFEGPQSAVDALIGTYSPTNDPRPTVEEILAEVKNSDKNVFDDEPSPDEYDQGNDDAYGIPDFIYADEVAKRSPLLPYVITDEEFAEGKEGHESFSLTWYAGDSVLADDKQEIVDDVHGAVGNENLLRFGHGSNDSRIVYVRNDKRRCDFEIGLHDGNFAEVVGLEDYNRKGRG